MIKKKCFFFTSVVLIRNSGNSFNMTGLANSLAKHSSILGKHQSIFYDYN